MHHSALRAWLPALALASLAGCYSTQLVDTDSGMITDPGSDATGGPVDAYVEIPDVGLPEDSGDAWHPLVRDAFPVGDRGGDVWDGYIEAYMFPSGSDHVRIRFDSASGDGPRTGVVIFGMGAPPPPVTDPTVGYPAGYDARMPGNPIWEGFEYPILDASVVGARVRVTVNASGLWEDWCEEQAPVPLGSGEVGYGCLPDGGGSESSEGCVYEPGGAPPYPIDCGRMHLCMPPGMCACTVDGCGATQRSLIMFDFHVVGMNGDGTITYLGGNVHLIRS